MTFPKDISIMVVDDLDDMRAAVVKSLARLGYANVATATDGAEALALLKNMPDVRLVISDWNMEPLDGLGLLAGMRKVPHLQKVPFILVSAEAGPHRANQAMEAGVSAFLGKPFDAATLGETLATTAKDYA
jgi:two-component system chemotaxis response regulator CheY